MLESNADHQAYLDAFGESVSIQGRPWRGIFDNDHSPVEFGTEFEIESNAPQLGLPTDDVIAAGVTAGPDGSTVVIRDVAYRVRSKRSDSTGWTILVLSEAS